MSRSWPESPVQLQGDFMHVREIVDADAGTLFEMLRDPAVMAHMSSPPPTLSAFHGFIAWAQAERQLGQSICFGIVPPGLDAAVGIIQLRAQEPSWFTAEWGFAIGVSFWGTGAFADAAQAVAGFAFEQIGVHRLEARASMINGRGNGVLQKLGARPEGALASAFIKDGQYDPQFLWGLHVDDWRQRTLVREPFSIAEAHASIAAAIQDTTRRLRAQREHDSRATPRPYPFFITQPPVE